MLNIRKTYKNKTEEIKALHDKYKRMSNATYWTGILAIAAFFLYVFEIDTTFSLGYGTTILLNKIFVDLEFIGIVPEIILFISIIIPAVGFFFLSKLIKRGKLIPLVIAIFIYSIDFLILPFINSSYFINTYNKLIAFGTHTIVIFYFLYLFYLFNKMVRLSNENRNK